MSYQSKSKDSFNTRKRFYLFHKVIEMESIINENEFLSFDVDNKEELVQLFTSDYFHGDRKRKLRNHSCPLTVDEIYHKMKELETENRDLLKSFERKYFDEIFREKFPEKNFKELSEAEECHYCGITKEQIEALISLGRIYKKNERGWNMEIDRKYPNREYSVDNCVPSCYWCNNAKTDEFTADEFIPIGEQIGKILLNRLRK